MMHGPYGYLNPKCVCMVNGKTSKNYPKSFINDTLINADGILLIEDEMMEKLLRLEMQS